MFQYLVAPLVAAMFTAVLSTYLTAYFSFSRFRREQWWQAKREAYESIIRALAEVRFNASRQLASLRTGGELNVPQFPEREKESAWSLQEIASSGAYIVSRRTVEEATAVLGRLSMPYDDDVIWLEKMFEVANNALEVVRAEAHRDLRVELDGRWRRSRTMNEKSSKQLPRSK